MLRRILLHPLALTVPSRLLHLSGYATASALRFESQASRRAQRATPARHAERTRPAMSSSATAASGARQKMSERERMHMRELRRERRSQATNVPVDDVRITFEQMDLRPEILAALQAMYITHPTAVQALTLPQLLQKRSVLSAGETGSGKTLAFLLPIFNHICKLNSTSLTGARMNRPRALILLPSKELVIQVMEVCKELCKHTNVKAGAFMSGLAHRGMSRSLQSPLDVAVGTLNSLLELRETNRLMFSDVQYAVIDEADTMMDTKFGPELMSMIEKLSANSGRVQFVFTCATLTTPLKMFLKDVFPDIAMITTNSVHRNLANISHRFIRCVGTEGKLAEISALAQNGFRVPTMMFCNSLKSLTWVKHRLAEHGVSPLVLHGKLLSKVRSDVWMRFKNGENALLLCTDVAARGLDCSTVECVIMADFPESPIDFLHRAGRTGRQGRRGHVISLVTKKDSTLAHNIRHAIEIGEPLAGLRGY